MIEFFVPGIPAPGGSKSGFPFKRKGGGLGVRMVDACKRCKPWRDSVVAAARTTYQGPVLQGPINVEFQFFLPRPQSHFDNKGRLNPKGKRTPYVTTRPDVLKLARAVEDALTGVIWRDDSQICQESLSKDYFGDGPTGVLVMIYEM